MYLRQCHTTNGRKGHCYWQLVESYRTVRGPRQRVVSYLGDISQAECLGVKRAAVEQVGSWQSRLFDEEGEPEWVEVDTRRVRVEKVRSLGEYWLGLQILEKLDMVSLLNRLMRHGQEEIPWSTAGLILVLMPLCEPSSELRMPSTFMKGALWPICWESPLTR